MARPQPIAALELQPSEAIVVNAASRIFSALIVAGRLTPENQVDLVRLAVRSAVDLALETDRILESDDEHRKKRDRLGPLG